MVSLLHAMLIANKTTDIFAQSGAGIAGLTIAAFLSKSRDIELHVFEAKSDDRAIGAGIAIWKRCWDILEEMLDFEAECISQGLKLPRWSEGWWFLQSTHHLFFGNS